LQTINALEFCTQQQLEPPQASELYAPTCCSWAPAWAVFQHHLHDSAYITHCWR